MKTKNVFILQTISIGILYLVIDNDVFEYRKPVD